MLTGTVPKLPNGRAKAITKTRNSKTRKIGFKILPKAFFQINYEMMIKLYQIIIDYYKNNDYNQVLDLYCGTGTIGMLVSPYVNKVIGVEVVKEAIQSGIEVIPIPGACALINALIASGIDTTEFAFLGFLALNKKNRKEQLDKIKNANLTTIIYEAPHKLLSTLKDLSEILEDRKVVLARELTKIHEEFIYGTANELLNKLDNPKGEFVIIIDKAEKIENEDINFLNNLSVEEHYNFYQKQGMEKNEIIKKIAKDRNVKKNEIYKLFI